MEKEVSEQTDMCGQGRMLYRTHTQETSDRSVTIGILYSQHSIFSQKKKKYFSPNLHNRYNKRQNRNFVTISFADTTVSLQHYKIFLQTAQ